MNNFKVVIETAETLVISQNAIDFIHDVMEKAENKEQAVSKLQDNFHGTLNGVIIDNLRSRNRRFQVGSGGNHIWISQIGTNERVAVIYLYSNDTKKYQLSNTSTNFQKFLAEEFKGEYDCRFELSQDHKCIYVWLYCDQDLIELGMKWEAAKGTLEYA